MVDNLSRRRVLNFLDAFRAGDIEGALAHCSDDVEFFANAPIDILPHMGHHKGKAELRAMWQIIHNRYSSMRYDVPIIVAETDKVETEVPSGAAGVVHPVAAPGGVYAVGAELGWIEVPGRG